MASATVHTLTNTDATSEVVTRPASKGFIPCRNTGRAYRLLMPGCATFAAIPISARATPSGKHSPAAYRLARRAWSASVHDEIACMMNCVEKIAPTVPTVQATMVGAPMAPSQVKYWGGSASAIGPTPPVAWSATPRIRATPASFSALCSTVT